MLNTLASLLNFHLVKRNHLELPPDLDKAFRPIYQKTKNYTMTSNERMYAMYKATEYIVKNQIPGAIVECGVWKGGSAMISAYTLRRFKDIHRDIYLYDTFEGMSRPTYRDVGVADRNAAIDTWKNGNTWCYASLHEVKHNLAKTGYPKNKIVFVKGDVADTIPGKVPKQISLLRLDTDWYQSTYHELMNLYPLLVSGGVLIIDDYGHWQGCKKAVDRYMKEHTISLLLHRIDYSGRIGIKQ